MLRHPVLLDRNRTGLLVVDIQEKILAVTSRSKQVVENAVKLIKGFKILERPIFITEQYPEGLGNTVDPIKKVLEEAEIHQKLTFSCCGIEGLTRQIRTQKIDQLVLCGIESHVCVWQTAMDLAYDGFKVSVVGDALSSRTDENHEAALKRMASHGIEVTTTEMVLFELLKEAGTDAFKAVSKLIK
jgi:nicotinamidase-related amidase